MLIRWFYLILILLPFQASSQQGYSYREYRKSVCQNIQQAYSRIPDEIYFRVSHFEDVFYAVYSDEEWFDSFFDVEDRHLSVQLVSPEYFNCSRTQSGEDYFYYMPPVSYSQLKNNQKLYEDGLYRSPLFDVPGQLKGSLFDVGIIISRRGRICISHWYTNIPANDWNLLETSLWVDTLVAPSNVTIAPPDSTTLVTQRVMDQLLYFEKDKTQYDQNQLKQFIHSLPLSHFDPIHITLKAYASVEGPKERNEKLYQNRAKVVFEQLTTLLPDRIEHEIEVNENWEEFFQDIKGTPFAYLADKSKEDIREILAKEKSTPLMESILKNHRKTKVSILLQNKADPQSDNLTDMIQFYEATIINEDYENSLLIQDAIFSLLARENKNHELLNSLSVPNSKPFSFVFNRQYSYQYLTGITEVEQAHALFQKLEEIFPEDPKIKFNTTELMFRYWLLHEDAFNPQEVLARINELASHDDLKGAIQRLLVNYHQVMAAKGREENNTRQTTRSIAAIRSLYSGTIMTDEEKIGMAGFFIAYNRRDLAERLLRPMARAATASENVLFYYINLTIAQENLTNQRWYQNLLQKAFDLNPQRFCNLFKPADQPGALGTSALFNEMLHQFYCQNCSNVLR